MTVTNRGSRPAQRTRTDVLLSADPRTTTFASADPACHLVHDATQTQEGTVDCDTQPLAPGETTAFAVRYAAGAVEPQNVQENAHIAATWDVADQHLTDQDEAEFGGFTSVDTSAGLKLLNSTGTVAAGNIVTLGVQPTSQTFGFAQPVLSVQIPAGMKLVGLTVPRCSGLPTAANGGTFTCLLPDGIGTSVATSLQVQATTAGSFSVQARLTGQNIGPVSTSLVVTAT